MPTLVRTLLLKRASMTIAACIGTFPLSAETMYSIQLGSFIKGERAERLQERLVSTTAPVFMRAEEADLRQPHKVMLGRFATYGEAWAYKNALPEDLADGAFVSKYEDSGEEKTSPATLRPFKTDQLDASAGSARAEDLLTEIPAEVGSVEPDDELLSKSHTQLTRQELLLVGFKARLNPQGVPALEAFLASYPADPLANAAKLRLARRLLARKDMAQIPVLLEQVRDSGTARQKLKAAVIESYYRAKHEGRSAGFRSFQALANRTDLPQEVRYHAMRQAAGSAHAAREYTTAVLAFGQLEEIAPTAEERAEARLQRAGVEFELAGSGKGSWDEIQKLCRSVGEMPSASRQTVTTARLMAMEAAFYANQWTDALAQTETILAECADVRREWLSASVWKGIILARLGRFTESEQVFSAVLREKIAPKDKFAGHEPHARAAYWLAWLALQNNDAALRDQYIQLLVASFPDSPEALKAQQTSATAYATSAQ